MSGQCDVSIVRQGVARVMSVLLGSDQGDVSIVSQGVVSVMSALLDREWSV